jgi:hypothetical protein
MMNHNVNRYYSRKQPVAAFIPNRSVAGFPIGSGIATGVVAKNLEDEDEDEDEEDEDDEEEEEDDEDEEEEEDEEDDEEEETIRKPPVEMLQGCVNEPKNQEINHEKTANTSSGLSSLDKLTMELLLPKNAYNKYLSKSDPEQFQQKQEFAYQVKRHRHDILRTLEQCLDKVCAGPVAEDAPSFLAGSSGAVVNADTLACFEQLCKIVVHDIDARNAPQGEREMFSECDISQFSLDNFNWRKHGLRVDRR